MTDTTPAYATFEVDDVKGKTFRERALFHAARAEALLAATKAALYVMTPINVTAAAVHAQLATAYAALDANVN